MYSGLLAIILFLNLSDNHAIYLSFVQLDLEKQEMVVKVFSDDLGNCLQNYDDSYLSGTKEDQEEILQSYFQHGLLVHINDRKQSLSFVNLSNENDASFLIFRFKSAKSPSEVTIKGTYFMELFPTQNNVIEVNDGKQKHFVRLTKSEPQSTIRLTIK